MSSGGGTADFTVLTTSVNDIEHMESQSLPGLAIIKIFFSDERWTSGDW